jgi:class 3 adenylate cyclase
MRSLGLEIRAGCHTGEVELDGDEVRGIAVHIGARVAAIAGPSEVLVSRTVRDLVSGSGLAFEDRGEHALKGVPDRWHLFRVAS